MSAMHFDSTDGIRFSLEENIPRITDNEGEEYQILTPPVGHPYCKKAEDGFTVAQYSNDWKERLNQVSVLIHLRRKRDLAYRRAFFQAELAVKNIGVETAIVNSPHPLSGFICTPPIDIFPHAIVVRPFSTMYIGASLLSRSGDVRWSLADLQEHPFPISGGMDEWDRVTDSAKEVNAPFTSLGQEAVLTVIERMKLFDQTAIQLGVSSDLGEFPLQENGADLELLQRRLFLVAGSEVQWLAFPNTEVPGNRRGLSLVGTELKPHSFEKVVEGRILKKDTGFSFLPERPVQWVLPHLWALKEA
jgi:hypothetical protein